MRTNPADVWKLLEANDLHWGLTLYSAGYGDEKRWGDYMARYGKGVLIEVPATYRDRDTLHMVLRSAGYPVQDTYDVILGGMFGQELYLLPIWDEKKDSE